MIYGSVCSGIEAATVAWHSLGWRAAWLSEIEKFPSSVLKYHYPNIPNLGNMTLLKDKEAYEKTKIDLLVGGTPCQSFSLAGLRGGLNDARGNLALEYLKIVAHKQPTWFLWENVPGVLSSNEGRDFGAFLRGIQELGYGFAYRVLDSQYFGVPQRRRRVFVVGHIGDWKPAAAVLFDAQCLQRNITETKEEKSQQDWLTRFIESSPNRSETGKSLSRKAATIKAGYCKCWNDNENLDNLIISTCGNKQRVRRLTPKECERLMGFEDDYTLIPWNKKMAPDGIRYKAIGNSMAVPVMRWIGQQIVRYNKENNDDQE